jgi:hypothetical protein
MRSTLFRDITQRVVVGNPLLKFWQNLSVPWSSVKKSKIPEERRFLLQDGLWKAKKSQSVIVHDDDDDNDDENEGDDEQYCAS